MQREATSRTERGLGSRIAFNGTYFPSNFRDDFPRNSENKTDLNIYLAKTFLDSHTDEIKIVVFTILTDDAT